MTSEYEQRYKAYLNDANTALETACETFLPQESEVCRAARYSLLSGGKRIRAVLVISVCDMLAGNHAAAAQFAAAVEMLHCYSLIHDDLPCMDNDDMRRGKPSCHKAFGEATAMLAGDVLLTEAFDVIANASADADIRAQAAQALAAGAGSHGMVYGQELDLKFEALAATEEQLRLIHRNKTGALINAAVQMGAAAACANPAQRAALEQYAFGIGLVFQIVDDVLDVTGTAEELGKPIGSDSENGKTTFVTLYGTEGAMELARSINQQTCAALREAFGPQSEFLETLAQTLLVRRS
jgi:geranylgeranyl diphosphate synthase type II